MTDRAHVLDALGTVFDPELDEPITALRFVDLLRGGGRRGRRRPAAAADAAVRAELRLPDGGRRARRRAPAAGGRRGHGRPRGPLHGRGDQRGASPRRRRSRTPSRARPRASSTRCASCSTARRSSHASRGCCEALLAGGATAEEVTARRVADLPTSPDARRCLELRAQLGIPTRPTTRRRSSRPDGDADRGRRAGAAGCAWRGSCATSLEANGGICRSLLAVRYGITTPRRWRHEGGPAARVPPGAQARLRSTSRRRPGRSTSS